MAKSSSNTKAKINPKGLGIFALASIVVSSMLGGGIYSLPQNMAAGASAGAVLLAWVITGIGIYLIVNTFSILSMAKPELKTGIYSYSRAGFGSYAGFTIGWSYWLCQVFGNVSYAVITMDALNYFFPPYFAGGNNLASIIGGSVIIWGFNFMILRGVQQASIINLIGTILKIAPLILFIIIMLVVFNSSKFDFDFWGESADTVNRLGGLGTQIKSTMMVTLWSFIGIEGAVVMSDKAKDSKDIGPATFLGFISCLIIYALLSLLPYGYMNQAELAAVSNPSTAGILEAIIGKEGAWIMNIGLLIAVLTSWLAWTIVTAQIPFAAAQNGTFPKGFTRENAAGSPSVSLWVTSLAMQLCMFLVYFASDAWSTMLNITSVMVLPAYFMSCAYLWKLCTDGEYPQGLDVKRSSALFTAVAGSVYALWLIYAAGLKYFMLAVVILALGIPVFWLARKQNAPQEAAFTKREKGLAVLFIIIALWSVYAFSHGLVTLN